MRSYRSAANTADSFGYRSRFAAYLPGWHTMYHTVLHGTPESDFPQWVATPGIAHQLTTDITGLTQ